jgi:hypothetical protein
VNEASKTTPRTFQIGSFHPAHANNTSHLR